MSKFRVANLIFFCYYAYMKNILKYVLAILVFLVAGYFLLVIILKSATLVADSNTNSPNLPYSKPTVNSATININQSTLAVKETNKVILAVPFISEAPDKNWTGPWKNACEEASMAMVDKYYSGQSSVSSAAAKKEMTMFFDVQDKLWGSNANSDAARTAELINDNTIYNATIIELPTISQIKNELDQSRPVIVPLYGFDLHNPNIPFVPLPRGTSYHMFVIIGYDDATKEFITNDDGDTKAGPGHRYGYDLLMNAIHDYSFVTKHADGPARAIFTFPKLVKTAVSPRVYYLHDDIKQWIPGETTFKAKGWTWNEVNVVTQAWLDTFQIGEDIK